MLFCSMLEINDVVLYCFVLYCIVYSVGLEIKRNLDRMTLLTLTENVAIPFTSISLCLSYENTASLLGEHVAADTLSDKIC